MTIFYFYLNIISLHELLDHPVDVKKGHQFLFDVGTLNRQTQR